MTLFGAKDRCSLGTFFEHSKYPFTLSVDCLVLPTIPARYHRSTLRGAEKQSFRRRPESRGMWEGGRGQQEVAGEEQEFLQNFGDI